MLCSMIRVCCTREYLGVLIGIDLPRSNEKLRDCEVDYCYYRLK
jgi:hypothetical protein